MGEIAIVTGYTGTAHVKSMHDRSRIAGMAGAGTYVLSTGKKLKAEMQNANTVRILDGDLVMQGCHATIEAGTYQELKIDNGTQGQKRNDLVVARYERRAQDPKTESVTLKIVKGTPAATPKDPDVVAGDILGGDLVAEVALWRVPLDGLNVGAPVALFDVLMPMSELRDSISQVEVWSQGPITARKCGRLVTVYMEYVSTTLVSNHTYDLPTLPSEFRPRSKMRVPAFVSFAPTACSAIYEADGAGSFTVGAESGGSSLHAMASWTWIA